MIDAAGVCVSLKQPDIVAVSSLWRRSERARILVEGRGYTRGGDIS